MAHCNRKMGHTNEPLCSRQQLTRVLMACYNHDPRSTNDPLYTRSQPHNSISAQIAVIVYSGSEANESNYEELARTQDKTQTHQILKK